MSEWSNVHAWKACVPQGTAGSNPVLSANKKGTFVYQKVPFCLSESYALIYYLKCAIINSQINKNLQVEKEVK